MNISIKDKEMLDTLLIVSNSIYKQYEKLMEIELNIKDKSNSIQFQKEKEKLDLILSFEIDYYKEIMKEPDNIYPYISYLSSNYPDLYKYSDIDLILKHKNLLPISRVCKRLDDLKINYDSVNFTPEDYTEVSFINGDILTETEKEEFLSSFYNVIEDSYKTFFMSNQLIREHNYDFLYNLRDITVDNNKINMTKVKYRIGFLYDYLECELFNNDYDIPEKLFYDKITDRKIREIDEDSYTIFSREENVENILSILDLLLKDNVKGFEKAVNLYDLYLYYNNLDDEVKKSLRKDLTTYQRTKENLQAFDLCEELFGKNEPIKVKIKKKKK